MIPYGIADAMVLMNPGFGVFFVGGAGWGTQRTYTSRKRSEREKREHKQVFYKKERERERKHISKSSIADGFFYLKVFIGGLLLFKRLLLRLLLLFRRLLLGGPLGGLLLLNVLLLELF